MAHGAAEQRGITLSLRRPLPVDGGLTAPAHADALALMQNPPLDAKVLILMQKSKGPMSPACSRRKGQFELIALRNQLQRHGKWVPT